MIYTIGNAKQEIKSDFGIDLTEGLHLGADHCTADPGESEFQTQCPTTL